MTPQYFKGNADEIKIDTCGSQIMDLTSESLDQFFDECFDTVDFLLMLYDEGRMPFSDRIPREAFVAFLIECIANANFIGTYESYIFLVNRIFGAGSSVFFGAISAGTLEMQVSSSNSIGFDFVARELNEAGSYDFFEIITHLGENISFVGFPSIESEAELKQLLSEFIPAGIYPDITLVLFTTSLFLVSDGGDFTIIDDQANDIIFFELGG